MTETKKHLQALVDKLKAKQPQVPEGVKRAEKVIEAAKRVSKVQQITEE